MPENKKIINNKHYLNKDTSKCYVPTCATCNPEQHDKINRVNEIKAMDEEYSMTVWGGERLENAIKRGSNG